jgi:hypothetical protein
MAVVEDECKSEPDSDLASNVGSRPQKTKQLVSTLLRPSDCEENGDNEAPTMSEVISPRCSPRDPQTSIFRTQANKDAFVATLPKKTRLQLDQPFGEDWLTQSFYLQKTGTQALFFIYKSSHMTKAVQRRLESFYLPARELRTLFKKHALVDFWSIQVFQENWEKQPSLSLAQQDMTTACLIHCNLNLPALVRWTAGPHAAEHCVNSETFACLKETCQEENCSDLVRVFTQGSPTLINAHCSQENYRTYRKHDNHSAVTDNPAMVTKMPVKEVSRGCSLMLDPAIMDCLKNIKQTPHGTLCLDHPCKSPRMVCNSANRPKIWCEAINDWTDKKNEPKLTFATAFVETLAWIWNLQITCCRIEIYVCDNDITKAFKQAKHPPNLAGLCCKIIDRILFVDCILFIDTGQTFGDCASPSNWERIAIARSQHAQALWHRADTVERGLPQHAAPHPASSSTNREAATFAWANHDSTNQGVLDNNGNRKAPSYRHHVDDALHADVTEHLGQTVCASALALYKS